MNRDEFLISHVQENSWLYDKTQKDFKNCSKKKKTWYDLAQQIKSSGCNNETAESLEKRWGALRDMFSRELRKIKPGPSGSGATVIKQWDLYKSMMFLKSHVAHRRTTSSVASTSVEAPSTFSCEPLGDCDNIYINIPDTEDGSGTPYCVEEILSPTPSTSSNGSYKQYYQSLPTASVEKPVPNMDDFCKRKKMKMDGLDQEIHEANKAIKSAVDTVLTMGNPSKKRTIICTPSKKGSNMFPKNIERNV